MKIFTCGFFFSFYFTTLNKVWTWTLIIGRSMNMIRGSVAPLARQTQKWPHRFPNIFKISSFVCLYYYRKGLGCSDCDCTKLQVAPLDYIGSSLKEIAFHLLDVNTRWIIIGFFGMKYIKSQIKLLGDNVTLFFCEDVAFCACPSTNISPINILKKKSSIFTIICQLEKDRIYFFITKRETHEKHGKVHEVRL